MAVMRLAAGELRDRILVKREERVSDGQGGSTKTQNVLMSCWARVKPIAAKDAVIAMKDVDFRTHEILIRIPGPDRMPSIHDLVIWQSYTLRIKATRPGADRGSLFLDCVTEV